MILLAGSSVRTDWRHDPQNRRPRTTPLFCAPRWTALKLEHLQRTGSFKLRGAKLLRHGETYAERAAEDGRWSPSNRGAVAA